MHRLQQHILKELIMHSSRRYSELKPVLVESNLFMYHLKQLINQGLVSKNDQGGYELTQDGQQYADGLSLESFKPRLQPRIVTLLVVQNDHGEFLMYRRKRQPLIGMVGFPYGKVHLGETVMAAANRELKEKTGLLASLKHRGDGYITMERSGQVVSQILFHLFSGSQPSGQLVAQSPIGEAFWADPSQIPGWELMPSVLDLIDSIKLGQHFFLEKSYQLEDQSA